MTWRAISGRPYGVEGVEGAVDVHNLGAGWRGLAAAELDDAAARRAEVCAAAEGRTDVARRVRG
jgi:hypothetical protein